MTFYASLSLVTLRASVTSPILNPFVSPSNIFLPFFPLLRFTSIIPVVTRCSSFSLLITWPKKVTWRLRTPFIVYRCILNYLNVKKKKKKKEPKKKKKQKKNPNLYFAHINKETGLQSGSSRTGFEQRVKFVAGRYQQQDSSLPPNSLVTRMVKEALDCRKQRLPTFTYTPSDRKGNWAIIKWDRLVVPVRQLWTEFFFNYCFFLQIFFILFYFFFKWKKRISIRVGLLQKTDACGFFFLFVSFSTTTVKTWNFFFTFYIVFYVIFSFFISLLITFHFLSFSFLFLTLQFKKFHSIFLIHTHKHTHTHTYIYIRSYLKFSLKWNAPTVELSSIISTYLQTIYIYIYSFIYLLISIPET